MPSAPSMIDTTAENMPQPTSLIELRECPRCHSRLMAPASILGQVIACPECAYETRALTAAGPTTVRSRPTPPPSQAPTLTDIPSASMPTLVVSSYTAPLPESRRERRSLSKQQLLDFVGWIHILFGGLYLSLIVIMLFLTLVNEQFRNWAAEGNRADTHDNAVELLLFAAMGMIGFGMLTCAGELSDRTRFGWRLACGLAIASLLVSAGIVAYRTVENTSIFGTYTAFVIVLFTLSATLTLGVLLQPRYRRAFGRLE